VKPRVRHRSPHGFALPGALRWVGGGCTAGSADQALGRVKALGGAVVIVDDQHRP
jgi:hypothetical protein